MSENISFSIDPLLFCSFNGTIKSFHHFPPKKKTNNLVRPVVPPIANYFTQNITYIELLRDDIKNIIEILHKWLSLNVYNKCKQ